MQHNSFFNPLIPNPATRRGMFWTSLYFLFPGYHKCACILNHICFWHKSCSKYCFDDIFRYFFLLYKSNQYQVLITTTWSLPGKEITNQKTLSGIPSEILSGNSFKSSFWDSYTRSSLWRFLSKFPLGIIPGLPSGVPSGNSFWSSFLETLGNQETLWGFTPGIPSDVFSDNSSR